MKNKYTFPKPSGKFSIGYYDDYIKYENEYGDRYLGFRCFYPSNNKTNEQMTYIDEEMYKLFEDLAPSSPACDLYKGFIKIKTNCYMGAKINEFKHNVLIYSPGYNTVPWANLVQIEELVSNGYIVFAVAREGESFCTILGEKRAPRRVELFGPFIEEVIKYMMESEEYSPDPMFVYNWSVEGIQSYLDKCVVATNRMELWAKDIIKVIDYSLEKSKDITHILYNKVNNDRFGAFGNSFGGSASVYASQIDDRVVATVNLDGWIYGGKLLSSELKSPALIFSKSINHFLASYGHNNSNAISLIIDKTVNEYMSDCSIIAEDFIKNNYKGEDLIDGRIMSCIMNDFIKEFFNKNLLLSDKGIENLCLKYDKKVQLKI